MKEHDEVVKILDIKEKDMDLKVSWRVDNITRQTDIYIYDGCARSTKDRGYDSELKAKPRKAMFEASPCPAGRRRIAKE